MKKLKITLTGEQTMTGNEETIKHIIDEHLNLTLEQKVKLLGTGEVIIDDKDDESEVVREENVVIRVEEV
jgi:small nuclear ribonucleoprotein (snRNP)-like protein